MNISLNEVAAFLKSHDNYTILTHGHPDGDTLGSGYSICLMLRALGKKANVINNDEIPRKFNYLVTDKQSFEEQTVISVDIADANLMGSKIQPIYENRVELCIDHHASNRSYAKLEYVDATASATAEIIFELIGLLGIECDKQIADRLYTGITTDTGCFRYANVTPRTHRIAAELMTMGADAAGINVAMFETKTRTYAALEKLALEGMEFYFDGKCAIMTITQAMFEQSGSNEGECDGIAAMPRQIEGVKVGVTIRERRDGGYKASVRTHSPVDASAICAAFGGGGHKNAAGCTLTDSLEESKAMLLKVIGEAV